MSKQKKTVLYVDGENFLFKVANILKSSKDIRHKTDITNFQFSNLLKSALNEYSVNDVRFYVGKLHLHKNTKELEAQSRLLIESQRRLKRNLTNDGVNFLLSGNVRLQEVVSDKTSGKQKYIFKEKGTDVQLAVDVLAEICDDEVETVLLLSSDSDMQPVVKEAKKRGAKVVYVGFEDVPNVGLSHNCDQTILLRKKEIVDAFRGRQTRLI